MKLYNRLLGRTGKERLLKEASADAMKDEVLKAMIFFQTAELRKELEAHFAEMHVRISAALRPKWRHLFSSDAEYEAIIKLGMAHYYNTLMLGMGGSANR